MKSTSGVIKPITIALAIAALGGCATQNTSSVTVSGETAFIRGPITNATAEDFGRQLSQRKISRLLISSNGGLVEAALTIARQVRDRHLDVEVVGECFSSCANYIFPAGHEKTISALGVVGWHGTMQHLLYLHETGEKLLPSGDIAMVQRLSKLEAEFFQSIGVDGRICWFGKLPPYSAHNLYFLSPEDMAKFGVQNVHVRPDYAQTDLTLINAGGTETLKFIQVDWSVAIPPTAAMMPKSMSINGMPMGTE